jgi:hypothetical protein
MDRKIVVAIFLTVVQGELFPSFDPQQPFEAYLADERSTIAGKWISPELVHV